MTDPKLYLSRAARIADMINAWFCPQCGLRDETMRGIDQDGTCSSCGSGCCTWDSVRGHLAHYGWEVVSADDARELARIRAEATAEPEVERGWICTGNSDGLCRCPRHIQQPPLRTRAEPEEWVCVYCEQRNVTRSDEDRCCLSCGVDLQERGELLRFLGATTTRAELTGEERDLKRIEAVLASCDENAPAWRMWEALNRIRGIARRAAARKESKP